ncbi:MAG: hypothetical protein AAB442_02145 [Patescibacteria group bacterium]
MTSLDQTRDLRHHAFVVEAGAQEGIAAAQAWIEQELGMSLQNNPDVIVLTYGLLSVADARRVADVASGAPFTGEYKAVIIAARRAYHEAQNALLKLFEEPPPNTFLFLILPSLGGLLPTLRSRIQVLNVEQKGMIYHTSAPAEAFIHSSKEKRSAIIKKLTSGRDEDERRENREAAIALLIGIERMAYVASREGQTFTKPVVALLSDIATLRTHLYDRSAPVKLILEHLSLVIPKEFK